MLDESDDLNHRPLLEPALGLPNACECFERHRMGTGSLVTSCEAGEGIREKQIAGLLKNASAYTKLLFVRVFCRWLRSDVCSWGCAALGLSLVV